MTDDVVHGALVRWLSTVSGLTVIKDRQGIARPPRPYLMVDLTGSDLLSEHPQRIETEETETLNSADKREIMATPIFDIEWTFLVFAYGAGCETVLRRVRAATHLPQVQEPLLPALVIHETGRINSIPEFIGQDWEPRAQMNLMLRGRAEDGFVIDTIEKHEPHDIAIIKEH